MASRNDEIGFAIPGALASEDHQRTAFRRVLCAHLKMSFGMTNAEIAQYLTAKHGIRCDGNQVRGDIAYIKQHWRDNYDQSIADLMRREVMKLDLLEAAAVRDFESGDSAGFVNSMLKIAKRRANLLGLDRAKKFEITDKRKASDLSDEELEIIIRSPADLDPESDEGIEGAFPRQED